MQTNANAGWHSKERTLVKIAEYIDSCLERNNGISL